MRPISNPRGRFEEYYRQWDEAPPPAALQVFEDSSRSILSENDSPDLPFRYSVNPYRGCSHACAYCYARPSHEWLGFGAGTDFETKIVVKLRTVELLREAFDKASWTGDRVMFSGETDCYQPLEAHYRLTRGCLEAARDAGNPVAITTKGFLVTRDCDLLAELAGRGLASVAVSIPFADEDMARRIEPGAPRPAKRVEAIRLLAEAGVPVTVMVSPIIPGLNDDQIPAILEQARDAGACFATAIALRLPHSVKEVFFERLRAQLPLRADRVEARVREMRGGQLNDARFGARMSGEGIYWQAIEAAFRLHRKRLGLDREPPLCERVPVATLRRRGQLSLFHGGGS